MTRFTSGRRAPGTTLLNIAPWLFSERFVSAVVQPTIADLQSEVAAAGESRIKRLQAQWHGYCAFWTLLLVAPFAAWAAPTRSNAAVGLGVVGWYERHPSAVPTPEDRTWRPPQINFSSTEVAGNIGGLIFVVGSLFVVSIGLPSVLWFLLAGTIAGCFLAWRLVVWHRSHPKRGLPENLIVLR